MATVNLDCRLDLKTIALHARNAEYSEYSQSSSSFESVLIPLQTLNVSLLSSCVFVNPRQPL